MSDAEELVKYCRTVANFGRGSSMTDALHKAADMIERQAEEIAALRHDIERHVKALCDAAEGNESLRNGWLEIRKRELRSKGMKVEQARIHAEAELNTIDAAMKEKS